MNRCLRERTLVLMYYGEETSGCRAHLAGCLPCQARYQQLVHDLDVLGQVLQHAPLPGGMQPHTSPVRVSWRPAALGIALVCLVLWGGSWLWRPAPPGPLEVRTPTEVVQFFEHQVTPALFATTDTRVAVISEPVSTAGYLEAALSGGWSCTGQEAFFNSECRNVPFALLAGEP